MRGDIDRAKDYTVTLIPGDGIGPECVVAAQRILEAAGAPIEWDTQEAGAEVFKKGLPSGVPAETMDSIARTKVALKGPLETPVGFGEKSANVTLRKLFETYANVRPVREMPGVKTPYSGRGVDLVVVRENVEDLYAGIEYMQTPGVAECLKLISVKGSEKIVRFAFEYARSEGRESVACATKANIMKMTEGTVKRVFEQAAPDYPDIESWHVIIDNCAHQLVKRPEQFDVIVTTNMNGDIISDLSSALIGGLGYAPSANIGNEIAIFEAVHGSAPKYAGKNVINPTAVILSAVMMLRYLELFEQADAVEHAVGVTLESGVLTGDVVGYDKGASTTDYTDAIIAQPRQADRDVDRPRAHAVEAPAPRSRRGLREADIARRRGPRRLRRVTARGQRAGRVADGAHGRHEALAQDGVLARDEGLPADRRHHGHARSLALPVHHQGEPRRPPRRGRARVAGAHLEPPPVDAHREAPGVRRGAGFTRDQGEN